MDSSDYEAKYKNLISVDGVIDSVSNTAKDLYKNIKPKAEQIIEKSGADVKETIKVADEKTAAAIQDSKETVKIVSGDVKAKADEILSTTSQKASVSEVADEIVTNIKTKSSEILDKINNDIKQEELLKSTSQKLSVEETTDNVMNAIKDKSAEIIGKINIDVEVPVEAKAAAPTLVDTAKDVAK